MRIIVAPSVLAFAAASAFAEPQSAPPYTEAVLPVNETVLGVAIGPAGPDVEFGLSETNGGLYRLEGEAIQIPLSDGNGLVNPTGMAALGDQIAIVDGNEVVGVSEDGTVHWRLSDDRDGVFFYDIEALDENRLLISDFGNGRLVLLSVSDGLFSDYAPGAEVPGMARFEIADDRIYAISWGSDDAWDGALYALTEGENGWRAEQVATGFGNAEAVAIVDGRLLVGGYRGHEEAQESRLMEVGPGGAVSPLDAGSSSSGISDIHVTPDSVLLTYFRDGQWERVPYGDLFDNARE